MAILDPVDQQAAALDALFRAHRADLVALCRRRLGPGPDAEDAAHEAMLRAWRARSSLDEDRDPWPWLATIAGNACIDLQRRRATARGYVPPRPDLPLGPEDQVLRSTHAGLVREALEHLSPSRREALVLREVEDWDYAQIAAHQQRSPGSVRTAVTRARQELRDHVESLARSRDQWPLAGVMGGLVARCRDRLAAARSDWTTAVARGSIRFDSTWEAMTTAASGTVAHAGLGGLMALTLATGAGSAAASPEAAPSPATVVTPAPSTPATSTGTGAAAPTVTEAKVPPTTTPVGSPAIDPPTLPTVLTPPTPPPAGAPDRTAPLPPTPLTVSVPPVEATPSVDRAQESNPLDALLPP